MESFLDNNTRMLADLQALQRERLTRHSLDAMTNVEKELGTRTGARPGNRRETREHALDPGTGARPGNRH